MGALPHAVAAVRVDRKVAERHPTGLRSALAGSLTNLSVHREDVGDLAGCLAPAREAVEICRELVARHPVAFQPQLAGALHNLADRISATGDHEGRSLRHGMPRACTPGSPRSTPTSSSRISPGP